MLSRGVLLYRCMIYSNYVFQTYSFDLEEIYDEIQDAPYYAFLLRDGTIDYRLNDSNFANIIGGSYTQLVDYLNLRYYNLYIDGRSPSNSEQLMSVLVANNATNDYAIINTSIIDFNIYTPYEDSQYNVFYGKPYNNEWIFDGSAVVYDSSGLKYNVAEQSSNAITVDASDVYGHVVLDYYNIVNPLQNEYYTSYVNQFWQIFHVSNNFIKMSYGDGFTMSLGATYEAVKQEGYDNGYGQGYNNGYHDGFTNGSRIQDGGAHDAFSYLSEAFNAVGGIMALQVLPNVTLGLVFSIPLTVVLIMTIFRLVRK